MAVPTIERFIGVALASGLAALPVDTAQAEDQLEFSITPYVWAPSLSADLQPSTRLPTVSVDKSFGDVLDDLDAGFFLLGSVRNGRFAFLGDVTYADLSETDRLRIPATIVTPELDIPVEGAVSQLAMTVVAGYSVIDEPDVVVDLLGGFRAWSVEASIRVPSSFAPLARGVTEDAFWVDPLLAVRGQYHISPEVSVMAYGDVGGFGAGSDLTWQAVGAISYRIRENLLLSAGYRVLAFDYSDGGFDVDLRAGGPLLGVTLKF